MKYISILFFSIICFNSSAQLDSVAKVKHKKSDLQHIYSFISNRKLDEFMEEKWEHRLLLVHPELKSIDIIPASQKVVLVMNDDYSEVSLLTIIKRFEFTDYVISE